MHLVGLLLYEYITMHGPLNVKFLCSPSVPPMACYMGNFTLLLPLQYEANTTSEFRTLLY